MTAKITINKDVVEISSKYDAGFVKQIKVVPGAKWNGKSWTVPVTEFEKAKSIVEKFYGTPEENINKEFTSKEIKMFSVLYNYEEKYNDVRGDINKEMSRARVEGAKAMLESIMPDWEYSYRAFKELKNNQ